jgi:hypothetical protein
MPARSVHYVLCDIIQPFIMITTLYLFNISCEIRLWIDLHNKTNHTLLSTGVLKLSIFYSLFELS